MKFSVGVEMDAVILGRSREAGEFNTSDGDKVEYGDAYEMSFDNSEGLTQTVRVSGKMLREAADFDPADAKYQRVRFIGDVHVRDDGGYLKPVSVTAL